MIRVGIFGASGYVGGELLRLLDAHPLFEAAGLFGHNKAGEPVAAVHPHLAAAYRDASIERYGEGALSNFDLIFAALPHGESQKLAPAILQSGVPFVDLGADFRLRKAEDYERWYGHRHQAPELLGQFAYGIPEIERQSIRGAKAVAAAGCHATAAILALKPLVNSGLINVKRLIVNSSSGASGAGREAIEATGFCTVSENFAAYGLLNHRHTAEIEMALGGAVLFTPHLAPMNRGILATCIGEAAEKSDPLQILRDFYADEPFVHVTAGPPSTKWVAGSNGVQLTARYDARTNQILVLSAIDNLGKGAAGQMIQCANLMLGLEETAGLAAIGVYP